MFEEVTITAWKLLVLCGCTVGGFYVLYRWWALRLAFIELAATGLAELVRESAPIDAWVPTVGGDLTKLVAFRFKEGVDIVPITPERERLEEIFNDPRVIAPEGVKLMRVLLVNAMEEEG